MARMIRKQVYIESRQQALIRRLARRRGVSEAQIIRQSIDGHTGLPRAGGRVLDAAAWEEALAFMRRLQVRRATGRRRDWKREDLYEERLGRYGRRTG